MTAIRTTILCFLILGSALTTAGVQAPEQRVTGQIDFIKVAPGEFVMGCGADEANCDEEEKPAHRVRISKAFELGKYEVTQAQWQTVMGTNPSGNMDANRPVENVSWIDVQDFLARMNARNDGYAYRLPTEAE